MSKELRECPFCGTKAVSSTFSIDVYNWYEENVLCEECRCSIAHPQAMMKWNTRPAEDALKAENEELRYIVKQFGWWYNEDGCPKRLDPDFSCSAETEYKNDPETDGDFDERDCWKEAHEHGCWVEYYRWKYRQKNNNPDTEKGGEDE